MSASWQLPLALAVIQGAIHLINVLVLGDRWWQLNADNDGNVFSWLSASAAVAGASFAALSGIAVRRRTIRYLVLAIILAFLSLDDIVVIHERIATEVVRALGFEDYAARNAWPVIYFPLLAAAVLLIWSVVRRHRQERRLVMAAFALFAVAVILEGSSAVLEAQDAAGATDTLYAGEVALEESSELAAWILVAGALAGRLVRELGWTAQAAAGRRSSLGSEDPEQGYAR